MCQGHVIQVILLQQSVAVTKLFSITGSSKNLDFILTVKSVSWNPLRDSKCWVLLLPTRGLRHKNCKPVPFIPSSNQHTSGDLSFIGFQERFYLKYIKKCLPSEVHRNSESQAAQKQFNWGARESHRHIQEWTKNCLQMGTTRRPNVRIRTWWEAIAWQE